MADSPHNAISDFNLSAFDPDCSPFEVVSGCCDEQDIADALRVSAQIPNQIKFRDHEVVYVITDGLGSTKIGVAGCPARRLAALQTANPNPLRVSALFWLYDKVRQVERSSIAKAKADGYGLYSEWTSRDWFSTALMVAQSVNAHGARCASSSMWLGDRLRIYRHREAIRMNEWQNEPEFNQSLTRARFDWQLDIRTRRRAA